MPVKRTLKLDDKENTPFKRQALDRIFSPVTGTMPMSPAAKTQGNSKTKGKTVSSLGTKEPDTEEEKSKLEGSLETFIKTRHQLEMLLYSLLAGGPVGGLNRVKEAYKSCRKAEGNSELQSFLLMGSADLQAELKRHKELKSRVAGCINTAKSQGGCLQGTVQTGSSYEFLKKILSG